MGLKKKSRAVKDAMWAYSIRVANQHFLVSRTLCCILIFLEKKSHGFNSKYGPFHFIFIFIY